MSATRQLFAAALFTVAGLSASAFAGTNPAYESPAVAAQSLRSAEAVRAEVQNLQARGAFKAVGEFADAPVVAVVPAVTLSRETVRAEVAAAQAAKSLTRQGEL